ncbi:MAG: hypothetical protein IRZ08_14395 [Frankia sp.]|nr:hypothetical protein [Frankia sp.]
MTVTVDQADVAGRLDREQGQEVAAPSAGHAPGAANPAATAAGEEGVRRAARRPGAAAEERGFFFEWRSAARERPAVPWRSVIYD